MYVAVLPKPAEAVMLLNKEMCNGEVSLHDSSEATWESQSIFMKHKLDNFREIFNPLKAEEEENDGTLNF